MLAAIDFHALGQVVWVSTVAGIGVTLLFSLAVFYFGKAGEARRSGQEQTAVAYSALAVLALLVFAGVVVLGVTVMLKKA